jgi:hypothetical protein
MPSRRVLVLVLACGVLALIFSPAPALAGPECTNTTCHGPQACSWAPTMKCALTGGGEPTCDVYFC